MNKLRQITCLFILGVLQSTTFAEEPIDFDRDIKPLISDRCYKCHGPDSKSNDSGLRLDNAESMSLVIEPGSPEKSDLFDRISTDDPDFMMPPPESKLALSKSEIEAVKNWIKQGGQWNTHWSFTPIQKEFDLPNQVDGGNSPIDFFVEHRLKELGLTQNPRADRYSLIRRVSFDLTGVPPTIEEINAFVNDNSPDAYEKVVERLLASNRFGERMASIWLDAARYSDTYGYQVDRDRFVWPWRDWVINAFNENMPYDQFLMEQIAGDLLSNATDEQILATTFNRLHPQKVEGGSVPEEFRVEYVADRSQTFATAFLGLTLECARCHDHKYDPISQEEYYKLFAFFNNIDEAGLYSYFTSSVPTPTLRLLDTQQKKNLADARRKLDEQIKSLKSLESPSLQQSKIWLGDFIEKIKSNIDPIKAPIEYWSFDDAISGDNHSVAGKSGLALTLSGDDEFKLKSGNFKRWQPFSVSLWINNPISRDRAVIFHRSRAWTDAGSRGYQLLIENDKLSFSLIHFWPGNAIRVITKEKLPLGNWKHIAVTYDGSSDAEGIHLYVDGQLAETEVVRNSLTKNITGGGGNEIAIGARFRDRGFGGGIVDDFRVYDRELTALEAYCQFQRTSPGELLSKNKIDDNTLKDPLLIDFLVSIFDETFREQLGQLSAARRDLCRLEDSAQEIMVMRELERPRETHLLHRGAYDAPGKVVVADTPAVLPPISPGDTKNRLALANWSVRPDNPLTSRVAVNRLWQVCFGNGLVVTPEDFGNQGIPPSHPRLLDWLANEFIENGWDMKKTIKMIVMSDTYCQSSALSKQKLEIDPQNQWLSRYPRNRLTAEMIRDNVLFTSGLLVEKIGGPSVKPYEVTESFKPVKRDKGNGLYRRSLYTYWKRTGPAPVMMALDASKRDVCRVKRERTNTSLQSLVLLNDPQIVEAARVMAFNLLADEKNNRQAIETMFYRLTSRPPETAEIDQLIKLQREQAEHFKKHPELVNQLLVVGEAGPKEQVGDPNTAALAVVCITIMNHQDCIYQR